MGQYANQPDFGTFAAAATKNDTIGVSTNLKSSCLYVGTGGDVKVILAGVTGASGKGLPTATEAVVFKNIPDGSFLPVIVDYLLSTGTTASDIVAVK
jgi:hypothetical protein